MSAPAYPPAWQTHRYEVLLAHGKGDPIDCGCRVDIERRLALGSEKPLTVTTHIDPCPAGTATAPQNAATLPADRLAAPPSHSTTPADRKAVR